MTELGGLFAWQAAQLYAKATKLGDTHLVGSTVATELVAKVPHPA